MPLNEYEFPTSKVANVQSQLEKLVAKNYYLHSSAKDAYRYPFFPFRVCRCLFWLQNLGPVTGLLLAVCRRASAVFEGHYGEVAHMPVAMPCLKCLCTCADRISWHTTPTS